MRNRGCCNPTAGDGDALTQSLDLEDEVGEVMARTTIGDDGKPNVDEGPEPENQRTSRFSREGHGSFRKGLKDRRL